MKRTDMIDPRGCQRFMYHLGTPYYCGVNYELCPECRREHNDLPSTRQLKRRRLEIRGLDLKALGTTESRIMSMTEDDWGKLYNRAIRDRVFSDERAPR